MPSPIEPESAAQDAPTRPFASFRLPAYAPEEAELWLVQVECAFAVAGITDDHDKFRLLVANLPVHVASQVRDVITAETGSFSELKGALSTRLAQSRASRLEALLRDHQLGDRKPTQLLRSMQHMLGSAGHDLGLLRTLFLQRLPPTTRAALALLPEDTGIDDLASAADRFQEASGGAAVTAVCTPTAGVAAACGPPAGPGVTLAPPASAVTAAGPLAACGCAFNLTEATFSNRTCFSCSLDFRYVPWQGDHPCLGWTEPVATDYLVQCGGHQPICQETWFVQSGILLLLSRGCTDSCAAYCKSTGFGVTRTTCNLCCERDGCNDHPPSLQATATGL
ncbi:hypothetical protein FJT64_022428 [Amphibalanus amphitrite]|uniref:DUF7041 domain-containing protein n=1 Tax=Amphibalanus amphitrite TaxID=1232801 RepID=A0A6A4WEG0_AMPAM|nr:hypothetical protein FJT64_022428 [Amphibalanus amphitrite]